MELIVKVITYIKPAKFECKLDITRKLRILETYIICNFPKFFYSVYESITPYLN